MQVYLTAARRKAYRAKDKAMVNVPYNLLESNASTEHYLNYYIRNTGVYVSNLPLVTII